MGPCKIYFVYFTCRFNGDSRQSYVVTGHSDCRCGLWAPSSQTLTTDLARTIRLRQQAKNSNHVPNNAQRELKHTEKNSWTKKTGFLDINQNLGNSTKYLIEGTKWFGWTNQMILFNQPNDFFWINHRRTRVFIRTNCWFLRNYKRRKPFCRKQTQKNEFVPKETSVAPPKEPNFGRVSLQRTFFCSWFINSPSFLFNSSVLQRKLFQSQQVSLEVQVLKDTNC